MEKQSEQKNVAAQKREVVLNPKEQQEALKARSDKKLAEKLQSSFKRFQQDTESLDNKKSSSSKE